MTEEAFDFSNARQGPVRKSKANKMRITIRIDTDVLDWFRKRVHDQGGGSYQTMMNAALRMVMDQAETKRQSEPIELGLRRLLAQNTTDPEIRDLLIRKQRPQPPEREPAS